MGSLTYGAEAHRIDVPDDLLAHLELVISTKLRRDEGFFLTFPVHHSKGSGRMNLWISSAITLRLRYDAPSRLPLDARLLQVMLVAAGSNTGLDVGAITAQLEGDGVATTP